MDRNRNRISIRLELTHEQLADLEALCPPGVSKRALATGLLRASIAKALRAGRPQGYYLHLDRHARLSHDEAKAS